MISSFCGKKYLPVYGLLLTIAAMLLPATGFAQATGEQLFQAKCAACHTIGGGRLVGPDLAGVTDKRTPAWLENFVQSSQSLVNSGDAEAVALFEEFSGIVM
ncbi:MAG: c-type cytochrome, partial [Acidiferrobacterales bacterium]